MAPRQENTREVLLSAGRDLFLENGPEAFSLREVARRAHVSGAAVYRHYSDKQALLQAVCAEGFEAFSGYLIQALKAPTPLARLEATGAQYLKFALERPRDYRVIFMTEVQGAKGTHEAAPTFQFLVDRVRECIEAGVLRPAEPAEVALTIWAYVHGLVSLRIEGHLSPLGSDKQFKAHYERAVQRLLSGLKL